MNSCYDVESCLQVISDRATTIERLTAERDALAERVRVLEAFVNIVDDTFSTDDTEIMSVSEFESVRRLGIARRAIAALEPYRDTNETTAHD